MIIVYTTCGSKRQAEKISTGLLTKRLCACTNIFPITSQYWWKGNIEKTREYGLIIKTKEGKFEILKKEIKKLHSYTTPCVIQIKVQKADAKYLAWLRNVTI